MLMPTAEVFGSLYARMVGVVFLAIAAVMASAPGINLAQDGVHFDGLPIAGKAEVRAYYVNVRPNQYLIKLARMTQRH